MVLLNKQKLNKKRIILICLALITALFFSMKSLVNKEASPTISSSVKSISTEPQKENNSSLVRQEKIPVDKIEVVHFHGTHQCWSCITVGEYALEIIKNKFSEEYQSGKIVFKDINGELAENREIVVKYQAGGSSLFVNTIREGQDNIEEDTRVWSLVTDKDKFVQYFENKLKTLLGK